MSVELLVNNWIKAAYDRGASDLHLEPEGDDKLRVRMRVDGDLHHAEPHPGGVCGQPDLEAEPSSERPARSIAGAAKLISARRR